MGWGRPGRAGDGGGCKALGKIVLIKMRDGRMLLQAELYTGQATVNSSLVPKKKEVFEKVVATVENCFNENFPE